MKLRAIHNEDLILPPYTVLVRPDDVSHLGLYNSVSVKEELEANCSGIRLT